MRLVTQFKIRSLYSFLSYCQPAVLWRPFQQYNIQDVLVTSLRGVLRTSVGHAPLRQIRPYGDVLVTSAGDILKTSAGDFPWRYIQDIMGTSSGRHISKSVKDVLRMSAGDVPWRYIQDHMGTSIGRLLGTSSGRPHDIIFRVCGGIKPFSILHTIHLC